MRPFAWVSVLAAAALFAAGAIASAAAAQQRPLVVLSDSTGPDAGFHSFFAWGSDDGSRLLFTTAESMSGADTDGHWDVYERTAAGIVLVSDGLGTTDAELEADFLGASDDGSIVLVDTFEPLLPSDTDSALDIYARRDGELIHVTNTPDGLDAEARADFDHVTPDGRRVFFRTAERLAPTDTDDAIDIYEYAAGGLRHISDDGPGADVNIGANFLAISQDEKRVFFETRARLLDADTDGAFDIYRRDSNGALTLVSDTPTGPDADRPANLVAVSPDGLRLWVETAESWADTDHDAHTDVYERVAGGAAIHVTRDPTGVESELDATFAAVSRDGARVVFHTAESMAATDGDDQQDVYERSAGVTRHLSDNPLGPDTEVPASLAGLTDAGQVFLHTSEKWAVDDSDTAVDVYRRDLSGALTLISDGEGATDANLPAGFHGASSDGARVVFDTSERLLPSDTDTMRDLYARTASGELEHLSDSPFRPDSEESAFFFQLSEDGERLWFGSEEPLVPEDTDIVEDVYLSGAPLPVPPPGDPGDPGDPDEPSDPGDRPRPPGSRPAGDAPPGRDARAPAIRRLRVARGGRQLRFALSERARVRIVVRRGSRVVARFGVAGRAGANRLPLRVSRRLARGRYRVVAVAVDGAGNRSRPASVFFRLTRKSVMDALGGARRPIDLRE